MSHIAARRIILEAWGKPNARVTQSHLQEIRSWGGLPNATPLEACLREAGLWDEYISAGHLTWASFRVWLHSLRPTDDNS